MATLRCGVLVGFLVFSIACDNADRPTAPGQLPPPAASTTPPPPVVQPPVLPPPSGAATTYVFSEQLEYPVSPYTVTSKYALHDNGAFSLQFLSPPGELVGAYQRDNGRISFIFTDGESASGTLNGDVLEVRYSQKMQLSDFENAVYRRSQ